MTFKREKENTCKRTDVQVLHADDRGQEMVATITRGEGYSWIQSSRRLR